MSKTIEGMKENIENWLKIAKDLGYLEVKQRVTPKIKDTQK